MCKHGTISGYDEYRNKGIDYCIANIVEALNEGGIKTIASCCGHGKQPACIALRDGREFYIIPNYEEARRVGKLIIKGKK